MANPSRAYDRRAPTRPFMHISHVTAPCQEEGAPIQGFTCAFVCVTFVGVMAMLPLI